MTLNFFGCFNVSGIKTQSTSETVDYEMNVANKPHINGNALVDVGNDLYVKANGLSSVVLNIGD